MVIMIIVMIIVTMIWIWFHIRSLEDVTFWYISNHTCVWHCQWADMFARQCWAGETTLGQIIADQWSRMRITFDRWMFQCDRFQSQTTLDQRCFALWRMWLRTATQSLSAHVSTLGWSKVFPKPVPTACSHSLFQSGSSEPSQLRYRRVHRVLLSWARVNWGNIELSLPSLFSRWQDFGKLNGYFELLEALSYWKTICIILQSGQRCWPNMPHPSTCVTFSLMRRCSKKKSMMKRWERLQPKVRVSATLKSVIRLSRFPMSI